MDFDDLRTDLDLECPHCNRKFQQDPEERKDGGAACPACGRTVETPRRADAREKG